MRRFIATGVIALHVLLVWLLLIGFRGREDRAPEPPQLVTLWLEPLPTPTITTPPPPSLPPRASALPNRQASGPPPLAPPPTAPPPIEPLVPVVPPASTPATPSAVPTTPAPRVDFGAAATLAARGVVAADTPKPGMEAWSAPTKPLPKPCEPKESSMEWKGTGSDPGLHWYGPIPVLVTKRCVFSLGVFSCVIGKLPEANVHLFDDMNDPSLSQSSVPDPNKCD